MMQKLLTIFIFCLFAVKGIAQNADSAWFVNNYTKKEVYITMRDGVKLFTSFYVPNDKTEKHPFLLTRTPYSCAPYGNEYATIWNGYRIYYAKENYIFVTQDVRGRYMSEGIYEDVRPFNAKKSGKEIDEASDTYDAVDWMVKNIDGNNGNVGVMGTSYPGFYSTEAAISGHPAIKAVSPQAPVTDWFIGDDFHHNGAFMQMDAFSFYPTFGKPHPVPTKNYGSGFSTTIKDNYKFYLQAGTLKNMSAMIGDSIKFWHQMMDHPNYDAWWQARNARVGLYNVKPAMLWVGGLFDAEDCWGAWNCFKATDKQSPQTNNRLVMGPWYHGQWSREGSFLGNVQFGSNTSAYYQQNIEEPFFQLYLKGKGSVENLAKANIFFSGANEWKQFDNWPAKNVSSKKLFIGSNAALSFEETKLPAGSSYDYIGRSYDYISDPAKPVPYTEDVHEHRTREYMTDDQRFASRRPDVLSFETKELTEDLTLAGPVIANLLASTSTTDADFVVKLIDVFPDTFHYDNIPRLGLPQRSDRRSAAASYPMGGYQMLVRGEIMRGKFRNNFSAPMPFIPGKPSTVSFELPDVAHTFKKGHKLMIQIQSSWFPLADRNPQKFVDIYKASASDFQKAAIKIYSGGGGTYFTLPVLTN